MTTTKLRLVAVVGIGTNEATNSVVVQARDDAHNIYELDFAEGMLGGMTLGIIDQARVLQKTQEKATEVAGQLTALTDARPVALPDGRRALSLTFEHALRVVTAVSSDMRRHLRRGIDTLDHLPTAEPENKKAH